MPAIPRVPSMSFVMRLRRFHAAGIEVILDIVLNHSAEIDLEGPTVSLRGIDNRSYYWVREDGDYHNWTGCGNTLNLSHPGVVEWARQCLRFWVDECHVDGFRFDLASVMGRTPEFRQDAPLFEAIRRDSVLSQVKLIAEPWDIGPGGYQVANFPPLFAEWNDHFRDISVVSGCSKTSPSVTLRTLRGIQRSLCSRWQTAIGDGELGDGPRWLHAPRLRLFQSETQ